MVMVEGTFELDNGILAKVYDCEDGLMVDFSLNGTRLMCVEYDELVDFVDSVGLVISDYGV